MVHYTISIYSSEELHDHCVSEHSDGDRAVNRAETFFEGAFNQHSNHSASVSTGYTEVPAPIEQYHDSSGFYSSPCVDTQYYEWLNHWWHDWRVCSGTGQSADVHLLLTKGNSLSGGAIANGHGVAIAGGAIAALPSSYSTVGFSGPYFGMSKSALHEFGHHAMGGVPESHQRGDDFYHINGGWAVTPMLDPTLVNDGENYCRDPISTSSDNGHEMWWNDCCTQEW